MLFASAACLFHTLKSRLGETARFPDNAKVQTSIMKEIRCCMRMRVRRMRQQIWLFRQRWQVPRQGTSGCHNANGVTHLCKFQILYTQWTRHQQYVSDAPVGYCDARAKTEACMISQAEEGNQIINHTIPEATALVYLMWVKIIQQRHNLLRNNYSFHLCLLYH